MRAIHGYLFFLFSELYIASRWYLVFRNFRNQYIFDSVNVSLLRQSGRWMLIGVAIRVVVMPAMMFGILKSQGLYDKLSIRSHSASVSDWYEELIIAVVIFLASCPLVET